MSRQVRRPTWPLVARATAGQRWAVAVAVQALAWAASVALLSIEGAPALVGWLGGVLGLGAPAVAGFISRSWWWVLVGVGVPFALSWVAVAASEGQGAVAAAVLPMIVLIAVLPTTLIGIAVGRFVARRRRAAARSSPPAGGPYG